MPEPADVFVLGLDDHNREILEQLPDARSRFRFHALLTISELQYGDEIPVAELLEKAQRQLDEFESGSTGCARGRRPTCRGVDPKAGAGNPVR